MTLSRYVKENGLEAAFAFLNNQNIRYIEYSKLPLDYKNLNEVIFLSKKYNIKIVAFTVTTKEEDFLNIYQNKERVVRFSEKLNCNNIRIGMIPIELQEVMDDKEKIINYLKKLEISAKWFKDKKIQLHYHCHHLEFKKIDNKHLLEFIVEYCPSLMIELDTYWMQYAGVDIFKQIEKYHKIIPFFHLKDYEICKLSKEATEAFKAYQSNKFHYLFRDVVRFSELGQGNLPLEDIILKAQNHVEFFFIEQDDTFPNSPLDSLNISIKYLKSYINSVKITS